MRPSPAYSPGGTPRERPATPAAQARSTLALPLASCWRLVTAALLLLAHPAPSSARDIAPVDRSASPPPRGATEADLSPDPRGPESPTRLVFICLSDADPERIERTLKALQAELADLPATVTAVCSATPAPLTARVDEATAITREEGGFAAIWLDLEGEHLVLYTLDPEAGTVRTRRVEIRGDSEVADLDALAVIARSTLDALLRDRSGRRAIPPPPPQETRPEPVVVPAPAAPAPTQTRGRLRLMLGYTGSRYAPVQSWQSGLDLAATYLWPQGAYAGASYLVTSPISLDPYPLGGDDFIFGKIRRRPFTLLAGYEGLWPVGGDSAKLGLEAEFGVVLDVMAARTPVNCVDSEGEFCDTSHTLETYDPLLLNLGFAPRVRFLIEPHPALVLYLGAGIDVFADQKVYAYCSEDSPPCAGDGLLFAPYNLRPLAQAGLIFRI